MNSRKLHLLQHMPIFIRLFGSPLNYDTERWENYLKHCAKIPWKQSKKSCTDFLGNMLLKTIDYLESDHRVQVDSESNDVSDDQINTLRRMTDNKGCTLVFEESKQCGELVPLIVQHDDEGELHLCLANNFSSGNILQEGKIIKAIKKYIEFEEEDWLGFLALVKDSNKFAWITGSIFGIEATSRRKVMRIYSLFYKPMV